MTDGAIAILLTFAAAVCLLSCMGLVLMKKFYNKLHYLAPPAILGTLAVAAAIALAEGWNGATLKAALVLVVMVISNPVLTHAAARACYLRNSTAPGQREKQP